MKFEKIIINKHFEELCGKKKTFANINKMLESY
jgi:hypothetical protein